MNPLQALVTAWARQHGLPAPEPEYRFHPVRRWRLDLAFVELKVAIELDGGLHVQGRHSRGAGREADMVKLAEAMCLGWRVLSVSPRMVDDGRLFGWLERILITNSN